MDHLDHQRARKLHHHRLPPHPAPHPRTDPPRQLLHPDSIARFPTGQRIGQWKQQEGESGDVELDENGGEGVGCVGVAEAERGE